MQVVHLKSASSEAVREVMGAVCESARRAIKVRIRINENQ